MSRMHGLMDMWLVTSHDLGVTWGAPRNITGEVGTMSTRCQQRVSTLPAHCQHIVSTLSAHGQQHGLAHLARARSPRCQPNPGSVVTPWKPHGINNTALDREKAPFGLVALSVLVVEMVAGQIRGRTRRPTDCQ